MCVCARACVAASGWSATAACCIIMFAAPPPSPLTAPTAARGRGGVHEGVGGENGEGGRMNESLNELYCVCGHACS